MKFSIFELGIFSFSSYVYYLTPGFIASSRVLNHLNRVFNLPTRAFNLATSAFSLLTRRFELVTREFELVTRAFELVTRGFKLVTREFEHVTRGFELVTREFELLIREFELITRILLFQENSIWWSSNRGQNISNKVETTSKIGQHEKTLIFIFACFLVLLAKFNFYKGDWGLACLYPNLRFP